MGKPHSALKVINLPLETKPVKLYRQLDTFPSLVPRMWVGEPDNASNLASAKLHFQSSILERNRCKFILISSDWRIELLDPALGCLRAGDHLENLSHSF